MDKYNKIPGDLKKDDIYVTKPYMPSIEEYTKEILPLWESHMLTNCGQIHQKFECLLKQYLQVDHLLLMTNGHLALELAIQAFHLAGEVITTPFTFASTTHAIVRSGLTPVFCDISEQDFTLNAECIEACITDRTTAIVPVHVYGHVCDIDGIQKIADKYHLKVIYDAAHTFGETWKNKSVAEYGDASILSFHATKVFHSIEGGAVICHSPEIESNLSGLRNFGIRSEFYVDEVGTNAKMDEFRAAMGICNLRHVKEEIQLRREVHTYYQSKLRNIPGIQMPEIQESSIFQSNYAYFPIIFNSRAACEAAYSELREHNIYARKYFYPLTSEFNCYKNYSALSDTPIARSISERVLTLPIYSGLETCQIDTICCLLQKSNLRR